MASVMSFMRNRSASAMSYEGAIRQVFRAPT